MSSKNNKLHLDEVLDYIRLTFLTYLAVKQKVAPATHLLEKGTYISSFVQPSFVLRSNIKNL
jgi:hypothetical protein